MVEHTHLGSLVALLVQTIEARGFDGPAMVRQAGIDPAVFAQADARLPAVQVDALWKIVMDANGNDISIAVDVARRYDVGAMHVMGFGLQACENLMFATERLARASAIFNSGLRASCTSAGSEFHLSYDYLYAGAAPAKDVVTAAILLHIWRHLLRPGVVPLYVQFAHLEAPTDPVVRSRLDEFFACPVLYRQKHNRIALALQTAQEPLPMANANLAARGDAVVDGFLAEFERSAIATVVVSLIAGGDFDKDTIARRLNISTRTLQRRLIAEQLCFTQLLTKTRREMAYNYLNADRFTIKEVAHKLGYSDPANFSRAFRSWYGLSPNAFRREKFAPSETSDNDS